MIAASERERPPRRLERLRRGPRDLRASQFGAPVAADGALRRVGVEVEFAGLELDEAARIVAPRIEADLRHVSEYRVELDSEALGTFRLEVDNAALRSLGQRQARGDATALERGAETVLSAAVGLVTPLELVTPPLAPAFLTTLDVVVAELAARGAVGTQRGPLAAFGVHYNPVPMALDAATIWRTLQAYVLLERWLFHSLEVDLSRKLSGFVRPYSRDFVRAVLDDPPPADVGELVDRYLEHHRSRNHALDLLPLLTHLDRARVERALETSDLPARPTFHFRLPNSLVGHDSWSITRAWRHWLVVEDLAQDPRRLRAAARRSREIGWTEAGSRLTTRDVQEVLA